jgi:lipopolysaccharide export system protein LptA
MRKNKKIRLSVGGGMAMLMGLLAMNAGALENDSEQEINIDSNTATYDDASGTSIYSGNVVSIQGSIRVNSDKLVVHLQNGNPEKLVFTGVPARFKQMPSQGSDDIIGEALTGEYYPKKNLLVLIDKASVRQGNATYSSQFIEYDSKRSVVMAGEKSSSSKRVHVTLKPKAAQ